MVDTIVLNLQQFRIEKHHMLSIQPPVIQPGGVIGGCFTVDGVLAAKAYHNADKFNLSIKPLYGASGNVSAFVQTSLPRYQADNNATPVNQQQARETLQHLESDLREIGVSAKVDDAVVSRLDLFRNAETAFPFDSYSPVLNLLQAKRMKATEFGGQGFMYRNTKHEIVCYDKLQEMQFKNKNVDLTAYQDKNVLRFEYRLKGHDKVSSVARLESASQLLENYDSLSGIYRGAMKENLFRYDGRNVEILHTKQLESLFSELKNLYPRSYVRRFEAMAAMEGMTAFGTIEQIANVLEKVSGNRMTGNRFSQRMTKHKLLLAELAIKKVDIKATPIHELYSELKRLVLAA